jgi:amidase
MNADRLHHELQRLGMVADAAQQAAWLDAVTRVAAALGRAPTGVPVEPTGPLADAPAGPSPGAPASIPPDDGPWVWRPDPPLPPTGAGPLDGVRLAVKDLFAVAGRPLRAGSGARSAAAPEPADAPVVAALRAAGAAVVGTVRLHEFAFGVTGVNAVDGTPGNPAAPGRVPGGSSSGSAAVVAGGWADVALGTDTGGSCRIPAACCGVVGMKPSFGVVDSTGVFPLAPSLDHVGWLTADVALARRVAETLGVIASSASLSVPPRRLGVHRAAVDAASGEVRAAFTAVTDRLAAQGWELVEVAWPDEHEAFAVSTAVMFTEAAFVHRHLLEVAAGAYGADVRARLLQGRLFDLDTYLAGRTAQEELRRRCRRLLTGVAAVVSPTLAVVPPLLAEAGDPALAARLVANTRLANLTGLPALSVPVRGLDLPVGIQVEAIDDATALAVAAAVEAVAAGPQ